MSEWPNNNAADPADGMSDTRRATDTRDMTDVGGVTDARNATDTGNAGHAVDTTGADASTATPLMRCENLSKVFESPQGGIPVLRGASLDIHRGQSLSIRGESGAGKTTLLYLLSALELPDSGKLYWNGVDALTQSADWRARQRASFLGFVFQSYCLIPELTVLENVLMARRLLGKVRREDMERSRQLLARLGLEQRLKQIPQKLSGGERQRVAVARALMNNPALILADEPTGNLDERTGEVVMEQLLQLCREEGASLVLVTHNPAFAARTDRQIRLHDGLLKEN